MNRVSNKVVSFLTRTDAEEYNGLACQHSNNRYIYIDLAAFEKQIPCGPVG